MLPRTSRAILFLQVMNMLLVSLYICSYDQINRSNVVHSRYDCASVAQYDTYSIANFSQTKVF